MSFESLQLLVNDYWVIFVAICVFSIVFVFGVILSLCDAKGEHFRGFVQWRSEYEKNPKNFWKWVIYSLPYAFCFGCLSSLFGIGLIEWFWEVLYPLLQIQLVIINIIGGIIFLGYFFLMFILFD